MTQPTAEQLEVTQADRDAAAWALDRAPNSQTWETLTAAHRTPDQLWQANRVAKAFARHRLATEARMAALEDALRTATKTANLLYANAVGCATNHYGEDIHQHGLPGWLADCAKDIEAARKALGKGSE